MYQQGITIHVKTISVESVFDRLNLSKSKNNNNLSKSSIKEGLQCLTSDKIKSRNLVLTKKVYYKSKAFKPINKKVKVQQAFKEEEKNVKQINNQQQFQLQDNFFPKRVSPMRNNNAAKYFTRLNCDRSSKMKTSPRIYTQMTQFSDIRLVNFNRTVSKSNIDLPVYSICPTFQLKKLQRYKINSNHQQINEKYKRPRTSNPFKCKQRFVKIEKISPWDDNPKSELGYSFTDFLKQSKR